MLNTRGIKELKSDLVAPQTQNERTQTPNGDLGCIVEGVREYRYTTDGRSRRDR